MIFQCLTTFPEIVFGIFQHGVVGSAIKSGKIELKIINPRDFTTDPHRTVDERPYGGGDGMVMLVEPLEKALMSLESKGHVVYLSPQGRVWTDELARRFAQHDFLPCLRPELAGARSNINPDASGTLSSNLSGPVITLICGRFAGIDERFLKLYVADEISIGDFILSGGELAAGVLIDSIARHIPGTLGNKTSAEFDSFSEGALEGPTWTRPAEIAGRSVPAILSEGNHAKIKDWRFVVSWLRTSSRRPDLLARHSFDVQEKKSLRRGLALLSAADLEILELGSRATIEAVIGAICGDNARPKPSVSLALVHWPILDKAGDVVCTNVTHLDLHDLARVARVYNLARYYVINRQDAQLAFVQRILAHWNSGDGADYNQMRRAALACVYTAKTLSEAAGELSKVDGSSADGVLRIGTSAKVQRKEKTVRFCDLRQFFKDGTGAIAAIAPAGTSVLLVFGTGFGLAPELESEIDFWLEPIQGVSDVGGDKDGADYRHLSVRSAVSICLDRLFGTW